VSFSFHHCKGKLRYVSVSKGKHEKKCCKGKKKMPKGCCNSKNVTFKKSEDRNQTQIALEKKALDPQDILTGIAVYVPFATAIENASPEMLLRPPPERGRGQPLFILHSSFLI
jgi:hypothetical protein